MYDIKQFRPVLYLVVLIGISGFCMAAESTGLWIFSVAMMFTNIWLIWRNQFRPVPRLLANTVTLLAFIYTFLEVRSRVGSPIIVVGQFLVVLQVVKIWEQRANRDYAQLLVLSLLLMVSAAISTGSLLFGLLFIAYLFLSLYCCLLFHLKVETDEAKAALAPSVAKWGEGPLRQDQRHLSRSMRRLTGLVAVYALVSAVLIFLFFPRNTGAGMLGQIAWKPKNTLTGFSEEVNFQQVAKITQNDDVVGTVKLWIDDKLQPYTEPLLFRGATHDYYTGPGDANLASYQWTHAPDESTDAQQQDWEPMIPDNTGNGNWVPAQVPTDSARASAADQPPARFRQEVQLNPTGTQVMFALAGPTAVKPEDFGSMRRLSVLYSPVDRTLRASDSLTQSIRYQVFSTGTLGDVPPQSHDQSRIDPLVAAFARKPEVTGGLAQQRLTLAANRPDRGLFFTSTLDEQIATNIEKYLRSNYKYTLDLTTVDRIEGRDPMVAFLYDFKKGHCEYFAGAMTLLCQSLGLDARMVIGFKCDDYNTYGQFYTIKESQAHAWVEVRTLNGWKTFDPTSGSVDAVSSASVWATTKRMFDFLEYTWQNSVISYSADSRDNLMQSAQNKLTQTASTSSQRLNGLKDEMDKLLDVLASWIVGPLVGLLAFGIIGAVGWFFLERWKLARRAARIGIIDLPASAQAKLMRQLGFYDDLIQLLARHRIQRAPHLTPLEFCDSLSFLPSQAYDTIHRMTQLFYRIRYGEAELDAGQRRRLATVIERLSRQMPGGNESL